MKRRMKRRTRQIINCDRLMRLIYIKDNKKEMAEIIKKNHDWYQANPYWAMTW